MDEMTAKRYEQLPEAVFIVDDDTDLLMVVGETMKDLGCRFLTFASAMEAYEALATTPCFLIVSDHRMPGTTGLAFCEKIRAARPALPFVLITGFSAKEINIRGQEIGVTEFLEKPFDLRDLQLLVKRYLDQRIADLEEEQREAGNTATLFVEEAGLILKELDPLILKLEEKPVDPLVVDSLFRKVHTLKSGAGATGSASLLGGLAHVLETDLASVRQGSRTPDASLITRLLNGTELCRKLVDCLGRREAPGPEFEAAVAALQVHAGDDGAPAPAAAKASAAVGSETGDDDGVWVNNEKLDSLMKVSGELIVLKNSVHGLSRDAEARANAKRLEKRINDLAFSIEKITDQLQHEIMEVRKVRLERVTGKLQVMARQLGQELGKSARLVLTGADIGVDKSIANALATALTHMVRNSLDHGIESPRVRAERGKPVEGMIRVSVQELHGAIHCDIEDDGAGIDQKKVLDRAVARGLIDESRRSNLSEQDAFDLLFIPGFSTADTVSAVSGRGVGMDVVKSSVLALHGKVSIRSRLGQGTHVSIELPVPKSVVVDQTILVNSDGRIFAVPLAAVAHIAPVASLTLAEVNRVITAQFEGKTVPLGTYRQLLRLNPDRSTIPSSSSMTVVIRHKGSVAGLLIEGIHGQFEAVVKPFDDLVKRVPGFKGTADLGDERIAYVLAPEEFVGLALGETGT